MICNNTVGGYECGCPSGYTLNADGRTCTGINESRDEMFSIQFKW